jgi:hypothetical protein
MRQQPMYIKKGNETWMIYFVPTNPVTSQWVATKLGGIHINSHSKESVYNMVMSR